MRNIKRIILIVLLAVGNNPQQAKSIIKADISKDTIILSQALWEQPLKLYNSEMGISEDFTLQKFRGKPIILDFWATWCSPCVKSFPKMDSLRRLFGDELVILPITNESEDRVSHFFSRLATEERISLPMSVIEDDNLIKSFPHSTIPHYVWIDKQGNVCYTTGSNEITTSNIAKFVSGLSVDDIKEKIDNVRKFNFGFPLLVQDNYVDNELLLTHSILTAYVEGFHPRYGSRSFPNTSKIRLYAHNVSLGKLYQMAFSEMMPELLHKNRIKLNVNNPQKFFTDMRGEPYTEWIKENGYCYELIIDSGHETAFRHMRDDLARHFQYKAAIEHENRLCLVLKRKEKKTKLESKGGERVFSHNAYNMTLINNPWHVVPNQLSMYYLQMEEPLVDETGIEGNVDLTLEGKLSSISALNNALEKYGLEIVKEKRLIKVIVIRDAL